MKRHLICWARNEADILEAHVRHHAPFVHSFRYVLHRCRDNSEEILRNLQSEGLPVTFRADDRLLHEQGNVMTNLMSEAARGGADWILPLDADEFLCGDVINTLSVADGGAPLRVPWRGYVPLLSDDAHLRNILRRITHRRSVESPSWYKMLIPVRGKNMESSVLTFGNHALKNGEGVREEPNDCSLTIAHFPLRSERQLKRKIYGGWLSHLSDPTRPAGATFQWEAAYAKLKTGEDVSGKELTTMAIEYAGAAQWASLSEESRGKGYENMNEDDPSDHSIVSDPVPCNFEIRYEIREADPVSVLMETAEDIAKENARLGKESTKA